MAWRRLLHIDTRSAELYSAALAMTFGTWLFLPWETYSTSSTFKYLSVWGAEWVFGLIVLLIGVIQYGGVILSLLPHNRHWILRIIGSELSMVIWCTLAISFWLSNPLSTAPVIYTVVTLVSTGISIKLSIESGKVGHFIWRFK